MDDRTWTPVHLLVDVSGSTVRGGFDQACNRAMPGIVDALQPADVLLSVLTYATEASVHLPLGRLDDVRLIPALRPGGLSSLAAGLRLLASCAAADAESLRLDGIPAGRPLCVVLCDGLPTDRANDVLAARAGLGTALDLHMVVPDGTDRLAVAGLRATPHAWHPGPPGRIAADLVAAVAEAAGLPAGDAPAATAG